MSGEKHSEPQESKDKLWIRYLLVTLVMLQVGILVAVLGYGRPKERVVNNNLSLTFNQDINIVLVSAPKSTKEGSEEVSSQNKKTTRTLPGKGKKKKVEKGEGDKPPPPETPPDEGETGPEVQEPPSSDKKDTETVLEDEKPEETEIENPKADWVDGVPPLTINVPVGSFDESNSEPPTNGGGSDTNTTLPDSIQPDSNVVETDGPIGVSVTVSKGD